MADCLNEELIQRYAAGRCSEQEQQSVRAHIAACEQCRQRLEQARSGAVDAGEKPPELRLVDGSQDAVPTATGDVMLPGGPMPEASTASMHTGRPRGVPDVTFEGYQILEELPRGGQAVVYKALHKATKMKVALKVLLPGLSASAKARRYFRQEVELAASLSHPNIVAIRDSGIAQGQYYFSMEYIRGQSLDRYVSTKGLSFRDKIILFGKICDAMAHAHQKGVIHRDLKPSNILVDERDEPHILDFGLAKTAAGVSLVSGTTVMPSITGQIKGTVAYMSPEQAAGRSDLVDVRSDVYSLGVILYNMFTGQFPYDVSGSALEALENIQYAAPTRPRHIVSRFNSDVEAILLKCLEKEPDRRYQSAAELRDDTQRWLDGFPIIAKSVSSIYLLRKIVARHRGSTAIVGLVLLIIVAFSYISFDSYAQARKAQRDAEAIAELWSKESAKTLLTARQLTFMTFLRTWHNRDNALAKYIADFLAPDSEEKQGADFLLDPRVLAVKEPAFVNRVSGKSKWFAESIIGEEYLRNGDRKAALKSFRRSYEAMDQGVRAAGPFLDSLLTEHTKARLYELTAGADETPETSAVEKGGKDK